MANGYPNSRRIASNEGIDDGEYAACSKRGESSVRHFSENGFGIRVTLTVIITQPILDVRGCTMYFGTNLGPRRLTVDRLPFP
jgi:hypothetical protein